MCDVTLVAVISAVADVLTFPNGHPFVHTRTHVTQCVNFLLKTLCSLAIHCLTIILPLQTAVTLLTVRCPEALYNCV